MSFFVRRAKRNSSVGAGRSRDAATVEFERRAEDADGLSVYRVSTDKERLLVVAAIACERQDAGRVDLIEVSLEDLQKYGAVKDSAEHGTTCVQAVNDLHCSLDWDPSAL